MKYYTATALVLGLVQHALAHTADFDVERCHEAALAGSTLCHSSAGARPIIVADVSDVPLSDAAVELRNPIAPQSNYTARLIEDDAVFAAQVVLRKNGCYDGRLDGVLADGTVYAIKLFEANMGLAPSGTLDSDTQMALRQSHDRFDVCR